MRVESMITASALLMLAGVFWPFRLQAADEPLRLVDSVDLERYQGLWYEIARLPNRFQDQCARNVTAEYTLLENGRIRVVNRCELAGGEIDEAEGRARRPGPDREAALEVRFAPAWLSWLPLVWGDYQIMALSDDYQHVMIGAPSREYLWILSRRPTLADDRFQALLEQAQGQGFDTGAVVRTPQDG